MKLMMFSELYSAYYNAVAQILSEAVAEKMTQDRMRSIVEEKAFSESAMTVIPALKSGKWQLLNGDMTTPIKREPTMPLTLLEKRWLKAIMADARIKLFDISLDGLEDVEPLFTADDIYIFDKYADGDPFEDEHYIGVFKTILKAIHEKTALKIEIENKSKGKTLMAVMPLRLEFSEKDDKFRLITQGDYRGNTVNVRKILSCELYHGEITEKRWHDRKKTLVLELQDRRNTLERVMMHFAHFEKQARQLENGKYRLSVTYQKSDETEMVIRVLSFGPFVKVVEPKEFEQLIKRRLKDQKSCGLF